MFECVSVKARGPQYIDVVVACNADDDRAGPGFVRFVVEHASALGGRIGFNKLGDWSYVEPNGRVYETNEDLSQPLPPGGKYLQKAVCMRGN